MKFLKKLFGIEDQTKVIEDRLNAIQDKVFAEMAGLKNENQALRAEIVQKNNRVTELLEKVRDQNEADLFLECEKIKKKILDGEKRVDINTAHFSALQNAQAQYSGQLASQRNLGGLFGGLGGGWR